MASSIGDNYRDNWLTRWPTINPSAIPQVQITREEFLALQVEVQELKKLLMEAKRFDEATGQPDCEMGEKVAFIKKLAEMVGVNMDEVFK